MTSSLKQRREERRALQRPLLNKKVKHKPEVMAMYHKHTNSWSAWRLGKPEGLTGKGDIEQEARTALKLLEDQQDNDVRDT